MREFPIKVISLWNELGKRNVKSAIEIHPAILYGVAGSAHVALLFRTQNSNLSLPSAKARNMIAIYEAGSCQE